ncbi:MAG: SUMF1/EgtB/PvdO family nonheme iron enzyme [Pseudomonadota bacterium]
MPQAVHNVRLIRIFVGSPSDVSVERRLARQLIDRLNDSPHYKAFRFEAVTWDQSAYPRIAWVSPQKAIEENLPTPAECDLAVFIFWSRVGTPLPEEDYPDWPTVESLPEPAAEHRSGSVWEFYQAMEGAKGNNDGRPAVLLLRGAHAPEPNLEDPVSWAGQLQACRDFFAALNPDGYRVNVIDYDGTQAFEDTLRTQLDQTISQLTQGGQGAASEQPSPQSAAPPRVPEAYRKWILGEVEQLDNPGLNAQTGVAITLAQIYVPALTLIQQPENGTSLSLDRQQHSLLLNELNERSLYVPGQAGGGKTTFCRWVLGVVGGAIPLPSEQSEQLPAHYRETPPSDLRQRLPVLIRLRDLAEALAPTERDWGARQFLEAIGDWLEGRCADVGLTRALFVAHWEAGSALMLLDGVDEVPSEGKNPQGKTTYPRSALLSGLASTLRSPSFGDNRVLLTSRPYGLSSNDENQLALATRDLSALPSPLQESFIDQWFRLATPSEWKRKASALRSQLETRDDLRELRSNPLMLHALCVKYHDGNQLPEDIHDLYDSIVSRVLHNRYESETQDIVATRRRLQVIALDMHTGEYSGQPRTQPIAKIANAEVERALTTFAQANRYDETSELDANRKLMELLRNSGLLFSSDQHSAEFAHLMFSYFLASERLRINDVSLSDCLREHGNVEAWHPTLEFRFAYEARDSLQRAMPVLDALADDIAGDQLAREPFKAALIGRCLDIAQRRGRLGDWEGRYQGIARRALALPIDMEARVQVYRWLGLMGLDDRPGVADENGLPSIDWVTVPAGSVLLKQSKWLAGTGMHRIEHAFEVSRYPITHRQFQAFLDAENGYANPQWWVGLEQPEQAGDAYYKISNYPRDSVSWYEATAFCRWLSAEIGEAITLPNEAQWQLAAGGPNANEYPWGDAWDANAANTGRDRGAAVGLWPRDKGVGDAYDFAGGLREWCAPVEDQPQSMPLRGAYWAASSGFAEEQARCADRSWNRPYYRNINVGFRVCRCSPSS